MKLNEDNNNDFGFEFEEASSEEKIPEITPPKSVEPKPVEPERVSKPPVQMSEKERRQQEKFAKRRDRIRTAKLKQFEVRKNKFFSDLDKAEAKEKSKTKDDTKIREIELAAEKNRREAEARFVQEKRIIETASGSRISYERRKSLYGYGFIAIWVIGVFLIFLGPLITSMSYSLNKTTLVDGNRIEEFGMSRAGIYLEWNSFHHYYRAFRLDGEFTVDLVTSLGELVPQVLMILVFSLFVAVLLNQKFKGRTLMRAIFFFPVLISTGPVIAIINGEIMASGATGDAAQFSNMFQADLVDEFLQFLGLYNVSHDFANFIGTLTSDIFNLLWKSGIQILIFLSALQQIPTSAKEAASMEGATAWEFFWKITFPTISPMILANLIYTIIDNFSDSQNVVMGHVLTQVRLPDYGYASAIAWIYFGIIALSLAVVVGIVSRFVFYQVD
ncbi:MAG: ABC transporter permease subunit [Oscillospiraceae bacterium]|nr:ABC transporter permease subunit [Oscillospiraceae bacterium]